MLTQAFHARRVRLSGSHATFPDPRSSSRVPPDHLHRLAAHNGGAETPPQGSLRLLSWPRRVSVSELLRVFLSLQSQLRVQSRLSHNQTMTASRFRSASVQEAAPIAFTGQPGIASNSTAL